MTQPVVFVSYSRRDEVEKDKLVSHLGVLQGAGFLNLWSDDRIEAGDAWQAEINQVMAKAKIAVLLITANFLNSEFSLRAEVPELLRRREGEGLIIYPIIARACAWRAIDWLQSMEIKPKNGVPVWSDGGIHVDEDLSAIAEDILSIIQRLMVKPIVHREPMQLPGRSFNITPDVYLKAKPAHPPRVLVVDDEPTWQRRLSRILQELNCNVVTAGSYEQAEDLLPSFEFDLITVDLNLDKSTRYADGLELIRRIRETFSYQVPIIIISGTGSLEEQRRAFKEYSVCDFIQKSKLDLEELQKIIVTTVNKTCYLMQPSPLNSLTSVAVPS